VDVDGEAEAGAKLAQFSDACPGVMTEVEVAAFMQAANAKNIYEYPADKLLRGQDGERCVKGQDDDSVNAGGGEQLHSAGHGREQFGRAGGAKKPLRVGIEGDGYGADSEGPGFGHHRGEDFLVAEVDAVEVADGGDGGAETGGNLRDGVVDGDGWHGFIAHRVTGTVSPS